MLSEEEGHTSKSKNEMLYKLSLQKDAKIGKLSQALFNSTCTFKPNVYPQPEEIRQRLDTETHSQRELKTCESKKRFQEQAKREMLYDSETDRPLFKPLVYNDQKRNRPNNVNVIDSF